MTREMYERAVERMRALGDVKEKDLITSWGQPIRSSSIEWSGPIREAVAKCQAWAEIAAAFGGNVSMHFFRSHGCVSWYVVRDLAVHEAAAQEVEKCDG